MASAHKVQSTFSNQLYALLGVEKDATGDSYSTCIRRAVRAYYADHTKTAAYQAELEHLNRMYPEENES